MNVPRLLAPGLVCYLAKGALATEDPEPGLLLESPHGRNEPLINTTMRKHLLTQASYQVTVLFLIIYGGPPHVGIYAHPTPCATYSNVDGHGIDVSLLNVQNGTRAYNPLPPAPSADFSVKTARCWQGPCLNLCCRVDAAGLCTDNLVSVGGHYNPGEEPLCAVTGLDSKGAPSCRLRSAKDARRSYCQGDADAENCGRYQVLRKLEAQGHHQFEADHDYSRERANSLVFNCFIFMQIFNEVNARKIKDELNVFSGLLKSRTFIYILLITIALQIVIIMTPVRLFFRVRTQSWQEWLFAVGVGAGSMPLAFLTKLISRAFERKSLNSRSPQAVQAV